MQFLEPRALEVIADNRDFTWEMASIFPETRDGEQEILIRV